MNEKIDAGKAVEVAMSKSGAWRAVELDSKWYRLPKKYYPEAHVSTPSEQFPPLNILSSCGFVFGGGPELKTLSMLTQLLPAVGIARVGGER